MLGRYSLALTTKHVGVGQLEDKIFNMFDFCRGAFCSAAADQAIPGVAELLAGKLPAVVTVRHHLVGQLLCYPRDRTRQDGVTCHHTALSRHHVRHCQHKLARRA